VAALVCLFGDVGIAASPSDPSIQTAPSLFENYCFSCHDEDGKKGDLDLSASLRSTDFDGNLAFENLITGKMPMVPDVAMGMVDVRDVARMHVAALSAEGASGHRFIMASEEPVSMADLAKILRDAGFEKAPSRRAPNFAIRAMGLFDREARAMGPMLGKKIEYDTTDTVEVLGWKPTPLKTTFVDMARSLSH
jgi:nucleoside-diphosphate-sugar epimerase